MDPSDAEELIPTWVATRGELNAVEQENIAEATLWALGRSWSTDDFDQKWLKGLNKRMFGSVWKWAGSYRQTDTNIGVAWHEIQTAVEPLLLNLRERARDPERLPWPAQELAVRFHYDLVWIHPFPNGNGRHARLAADIVVDALDGSRLSWGAGSALVDAGPTRANYLEALRDVDRTGDFTRLLAFATS